MGRRDPDAERPFTTRESRVVEKRNESMFERLFAPESLDTSCSSSEGSQTNLSTLSDSSGDSYEESTISSDGTQIFDRELRAKHRTACKNMTHGKFSRAIKTFEGILADLLDRYGEEHHRVGAALHNVAVANLRAGQLDDARDAIEEAVRIRKLTLGDGSSKVADSLVEYGIILLSMKSYEESLDVFKEALKLRNSEAENARGNDAARDARLKMAKIRHNIGCVNFEIGNLKEAEEAYAKAIQQQKKAFETWSSPFMIMTDTTRPGYLTMASTMCNKGYIDLEQSRYSEAIKTFFESLKIQKKLLEADNKLILSTLENVGFAFCMIRDFEKGALTYKELVGLQQESYGEQAQKGWSQSLKRLIFCQIKLYEFEAAFDNLRLLEQYLSRRATKSRTVAEDLRIAHQLMGEVNYQIFKFPSLAEYTTRAVNCGLCNDDRDGIDVDPWFPKKPSNGSKMSGHRMSYA